MASIDIDRLAAEITNGLAEYSQDVVRGVNVSSERVGQAAVKKLKATSPKKSGKYRKAWKLKTEPAVGQPNRQIIHVKKPHYRLTHLLEHGHAKAGGGRVEGKPHIGPVEKEVIKEFMEEVVEVIKNG